MKYSFVTTQSITFVVISGKFSAKQLPVSDEEAKS